MIVWIFVVGLTKKLLAQALLNSVKKRFDLVPGMQLAPPREVISQHGPIHIDDIFNHRDLLIRLAG